MRIGICALLIAFYITPAFSGAERVSIKWDGNYSYNTTQQYDSKKKPNWIGNIRAGHSRNFQNGATQEAFRTFRDGELIAWLWKPKGDGPFPFVVFLHGCGGIAMTSTWAGRMAEQLNAAGIGFLSLDSFTTRSVQLTCGAPGGHWMRRRADDAYSALDYLVERGLAQKDKVYMLGHSNGASTTLIAAERRYLERRNHFAAFVPLEPTCRTMSQPFYAPVYMLLAELDEWTDNGFCLKLAKDRRGDKEPIQITMIKGTHHAYLFPGPTVHVSSLNGRKIGYDPVGSLVGNELLLAFLKNPKAENTIQLK